MSNAERQAQLAPQGWLLKPVLPSLSCGLECFKLRIEEESDGDLPRAPQITAKDPRA